MSLTLTPEAKARTLGMLRDLAADLEAHGSVTACCHCEHFGERAFCRHWSSDVPKHAQAHGCDQFQEEVPF